MKSKEMRKVWKRTRRGGDETKRREKFGNEHRGR
jgi:hypothetical protein